jgi:hypothetical protein
MYWVDTDMQLSRHQEINRCDDKDKNKTTMRKYIIYIVEFRLVRKKFHLFLKYTSSIYKTGTDTTLPLKTWKEAREKGQQGCFQLVSCSFV